MSFEFIKDQQIAQNQFLPLEELIDLIDLSVVRHLKQISDKDSTETVGVTSAFVNFSVLVLIFTEYVPHTFFFKLFFNVILNLVKPSVNEIRW